MFSLTGALISAELISVLYIWGVIVAHRVISLVNAPSYLITSATAAARRQQWRRLPTKESGRGATPLGYSAV